MRVMTKRKGLTVVTGASSNRAAPLLNLLRSLQLSGARARVVAYDLGLLETEVVAAAALCHELRRFRFEDHPPWVDIAHERGQYAWRPIIVSEVAAETGGPVLWLDAGDLVHGDLGALLAVLEREGFYSPRSAGTIRDWTHPATLAWMHVSDALLDAPNRNAAIVGFDPRRPGMARMVETWRACALTRACIAPPGSSRANHRQDQAVLSVLARQFQRSFAFEMHDEAIDVSTHHDRVPASEVPATLAALRARPLRAGVARLRQRLRRLARAWLARLAQARERSRRRSARRWKWLDRHVTPVLKAIPGWSWPRPTAARGAVRAALARLRRLPAKPPPRPRRAFPVVVPEVPAEVRAGPARLRVVQVGHGSLPIPPDGWGATERGLWNLHTRFAACGIESIVLNTRDPDLLPRHLDAIRPAIVHLHAELNIEPVLAWKARNPDVPLVLTSHDAYAMTMPVRILDPARAATAVIALSPAIRDACRRQGMAAVHLIPNGVDCSIFRPLDKRPSTVAAVASNQKRKRLADIARFFIDRPAFHLTICGPHTDRKNPDGTDSIPRAPNITVLGDQPQHEIAGLLGASEYFVHLCEIEASALAVREAMAAGCKVWTVPYNAQDLDAVALFWDHAISDPTLGERARAEALAHLDWSHVARRIAEVYRSLVRS